jgi:ankyrin repeat protein
MQEGMTALHSAAYKGHLEVVQLLHSPQSAQIQDYVRGCSEICMQRRTDNETFCHLCAAVRMDATTLRRGEQP